MTKKKIMVINDTQEILEAFHEILTDEGYEVVLYSYAVEDIEVIEQQKPDLIILDYMYGNQPLGWQTLQKIKMYRTTRNIPIIISTAATREVREQEGFLLIKRVHFLPKPFDIEDLIKMVHIALNENINIASVEEPLQQSEPEEQGGDG